MQHRLLFPQAQAHMSCKARAGVLVTVWVFRFIFPEQWKLFQEVSHSQQIQDQGWKPWELSAGAEGLESAEGTKDQGVGSRLVLMISYSFHLPIRPPHSFVGEGEGGWGGGAGAKEELDCLISNGRWNSSEDEPVVIRKSRLREAGVGKREDREGGGFIHAI